MSETLIKSANPHTGPLTHCSFTQELLKNVMPIMDLNMDIKVMSWWQLFLWFPKAKNNPLNSNLSLHAMFWQDKNKDWEKHRPQLNIYLFNSDSSIVPQTWLSKCQLPCVKSVRPASNQSLHSKANIMWQLTNPCSMSPPCPPGHSSRKAEQTALSYLLHPC